MGEEAENLRRAAEIERLFGTDLFLAEAGPGPAGDMETLEDVRKWVDDCTKCPLHEGRTNIVFGEGSENARLVFVGEGPGAEEDRTGRPFVGRAGQMLTRIIENVLYLKRGDVYICNILKCRPPGNRNPHEDEAAMCLPYLRKQLAVIRPEIIVLLGGVAVRYLMETSAPIGRMRGRFHTSGEVKIMPTYHPAYLLRNPNEKRKVYEDMLMVRDALGIKPPEE